MIPKIILEFKNLDKITIEIVKAVRQSRRVLEKYWIIIMKLNIFSISVT